MSANERMPTLDQFGSRQRVIPAEVTGPLRTWRTRVHAVLLVIFLALPWIKINGLQAVLLDIPGRKFELFGTLFLAHDAPLLFFIVIFLALMLALATALWGRVWCGWACPQTVFIDAVYRRIEIWVEGGYLERRRRHAESMSAGKFARITLKWSLFLLVSSMIAHSFIAYFTGSSRLIGMIQGSPSEHWTYFVVVSAVTAALLFNFGWFREQFCIIMCPYGRFQSVLMDQHSVTVMYDEKRGEPRKSNLNTDSHGDCISCNRCVEVCPTGIDIRNGIQMECIGCTACIDACNLIMRKVHKPEGLIRHQRISGQAVSWFRPRIAVYAVLALLSVSGLAGSLLNRSPFSVTLLRAKDTPYQTLPEDKVLNHFKVHVMNQTRHAQEFEFSLPQVELDRGVQLTQGKAINPVAAGGSAETHLFVILPKAAFARNGQAPLTIEVREHKSARSEPVDVTALGPISP